MTSKVLACGPHQGTSETLSKEHLNRQTKIKKVKQQYDNQSHYSTNVSVNGAHTELGLIGGRVDLRQSHTNIHT